MPTYRTRDFATEAPKIAKVAGNPLAPLQLNFDELLPGKVHVWLSIMPTEYGYVAARRCGWRSREVPKKRSARYELRAHLGRTPQGQAVLRTVRKLGRSANGS